MAGRLGRNQEDNGGDRAARVTIKNRPAGWCDTRVGAVTDAPLQPRGIDREAFCFVQRAIIVGALCLYISLNNTHHLY